jgi:hypothetical protein
MFRCDVFEKKIDALVGLHDPPIKIGGFKMIDVLIAQVDINPPLHHV